MWTPREIEDRLEEAALTLKRLPNPAGSGAKGYGSSWPDYVRDPRHAYGYDQARVRVVPNPTEIQRMEDALDWLRLVELPDDRRILWMRASGYRWRAVGCAVGVVRQTAWRRWVAGLVTICNHLNAQEKKGGGGASSKAGRSAAKQSGAGPRPGDLI